MKPKVKEILFGAFTIICFPVGFSIHGWPSLCFLLIGSACAAIALYFTLLNHRVHEVTESQARNWGLVLFTVALVGCVLYWGQYKTSIKPDGQSIPGPFPALSTDVNNVAEDIVYPGFSFFLVLKPEKNTNSTEPYAYVLDVAKDAQRNRMSVYTESNDLCFRVIDNESQSIIVKAPEAFDSFNFDNVIFLDCEYGYTNDFSFLRIFINGKLIAEKQLSQKVTVELSAPFNVQRNGQILTIGSDIERKYPGRFYLSEFLGYSYTLTGATKADMLSYFSHKYQ